MTHLSCISKIEFLNNRLKKLEQPWYKWSVNISWDKINKWCNLLGYRKGNNVK